MKNGYPKAKESSGLAKEKLKTDLAKIDNFEKELPSRMIALTKLAEAFVTAMEAAKQAGNALENGLNTFSDQTYEAIDYPDLATAFKRMSYVAEFLTLCFRGDRISGPHYFKKELAELLEYVQDLKPQSENRAKRRRKDLMNPAPYRAPRSMGPPLPVMGDLADILMPRLGPPKEPTEIESGKVFQIPPS